MSYAYDMNSNEYNEATLLYIVAYLIDPFNDYVAGQERPEIKPLC
jgi:hypothetical protein